MKLPPLSVTLELPRRVATGPVESFTSKVPPGFTFRPPTAADGSEPAPLKLNVPAFTTSPVPVLAPKVTVCAVVTFVVPVPYLFTWNGAGVVPVIALARLMVPAP